MSQFSSILPYSWWWLTKGHLFVNSPFLVRSINSRILLFIHTLHLIGLESYLSPFSRTLFLSQISTLQNSLWQKVDGTCQRQVWNWWIRQVSNLKYHSKQAYRLFLFLSSLKSTSLNYYGILQFLLFTIFGSKHLPSIQESLNNIFFFLLNYLFLKVIQLILQPF